MFVSLDITRSRGYDCLHEVRGTDTQRNDKPESDMLGALRGTRCSPPRVGQDPLSLPRIGRVPGRMLLQGVVVLLRRAFRTSFVLRERWFRIVRTSRRIRRGSFLRLLRNCLSGRDPVTFFDGPRTRGQGRREARPRDNFPPAGTRGAFRQRSPGRPPSLRQATAQGASPLSPPRILPALISLRRRLFAPVAQAARR